MVAIELRQRLVQAMVAGLAFDDRQRQAIDEQQQVWSEQVTIGVFADVLVHYMKVVVGDCGRIKEAHAERFALGILHLDV